MNTQTSPKARRRLSVTLLLALIAGGSGVRADVPESVASISRQEFAKRTLRITENMTAAQVEALLGKPEYIGHFGSPAVWFYGCMGPHQLPTLATIYWNTTSRPKLLTRFDAVPPLASVISEAELRRAILILDQMPSIVNADPGARIRVVNELLPLGKAKILAAIKEYERVVMADTRPDLSVEWRQPLPEIHTVREAFYRDPLLHLDGTDGLIFLLRLLFDNPPSSSSRSGQTLPLPYPKIGAVTPAEPFDHSLSPRFPVAIIDDVPLLAVADLYGSGTSPSAADELSYFQKFGRLRATPLQPTDRPDKILSDFEASPPWLVNQAYRWDVGYENQRGKPVFNRPDVRLTRSVERVVKEQILRLLAPLYPETAHFDRNAVRTKGFSVGIDLSQWDTVMADLKVHPVRWNPMTEEYERVARTVQ